MNPATAMRMRKNQGFTAIEITAVATIIAILALILIPLLQDRIETSRITAAKADLNQLMKAEMLVFADINHYARLQDLDNTNEGNTTTDLSVPWCYWNVEINAQKRKAITSNDPAADSAWKGPYLAFNRSLTIDQLYTDHAAPYFFWGQEGSGGPIFISSKDINTNGVNSTPVDRYPVDPWGNPYIFFGPEDWDLAYLQLQTTNANLGSDQKAPTVWPKFQTGVETAFNTSVIYCMGKDGEPGDGGTLNPPDDLQRPSGPTSATGKTLGSGDDYMVQF